MAVVYLALGSNVGIGNQQLNKAITLLEERLSNVKQAPHYASKAVGYTKQPDFINTVIQAETDLSPQDLLEFTQNVEETIGRIRRFRWGPREIDIDIIFYDNQVVNSPTLIFPHPRFSERDFVLRPLHDLNPEMVDPLSHKTIRELYEQLPESNFSIIN
jgi:2-amino-4-hydroxy-6-hydroxymethyldihydropteridine diphosphokinase